MRVGGGRWNKKRGTRGQRCSLSQLHLRRMRVAGGGEHHIRRAAGRRLNVSHPGRGSSPPDAVEQLVDHG
jgi:hypothetical protein